MQIVGIVVGLILGGFVAAWIGRYTGRKIAQDYEQYKAECGKLGRGESCPPRKR